MSSKGQLVIPKEIREKLKLTPKKPVIVELMKGYAVVKPIPDLRRRLRGSLKRKSSMSRALVKEHRSEVRENKKSPI